MKRKILYLSTSGCIIDYRFLSSISIDYEVLFVQFSPKQIVDEILSIKNLNIIKKVPFIKSLPLSSELFNLKKIYKEFKPDILHSGYVWQDGILASLLNIHPHLSMVWGSDVLVEPKKNPLIKLLVRKVMRQADHIQCDANYVKEQIINDYKIKEEIITVFPWGIDLKLFKPIDKNVCRRKLNFENEKFIIYFNRPLSEIYGIEYLLNGYKLFADSKEDVELNIISDGPLLDYTRKFISENKLQNKIKIIGRKVNSILPVYLNASDIYISPSLSDGTSLSLLEAMACGTGILVSDVPAVMEWINNNNGLIVRRKSVSDICDKLNFAYNNRDLMKKFVKINIDIINEKADWGKNYSALKNIYEKLLSKKN